METTADTIVLDEVRQTIKDANRTISQKILAILIENDSDKKAEIDSCRDSFRQLLTSVLARLAVELTPTSIHKLVEVVSTEQASFQNGLNQLTESIELPEAIQLISALKGSIERIVNYIDTDVTVQAQMIVESLRLEGENAQAVLDICSPTALNCRWNELMRSDLRIISQILKTKECGSRAISLRELASTAKISSGYLSQLLDSHKNASHAVLKSLVFAARNLLIAKVPTIPAAPSIPTGPTTTPRRKSAMGPKKPL